MKPTGNSSGKNDWRIQPIPSSAPYTMVETNWGALLGALFFVVGIVGSLKVGALVLVAIFGFLLALLSLLFAARTARKNWKKVGVQCEFELHGKQYTVTPDYWSTFMSERRLQKFLNKVISPDGTCQLWVNPKNPLQAELSANDIRDFLLH